MERWVRLIKQPKKIKNTSRKKTKRQQILEIMEENKKICWTDIQNRVKYPSKDINKLKEEGIVEFFEIRIYRRFLEGGLPCESK